MTDGARIHAIREAFAAENVAIAEVGAWKNMLDPDVAARKANLDYVTERLALADAVAARCCVDIAGSYNPKFWYGMDPKNLSKQFFDATVAKIKIDVEVAPPPSDFAGEAVTWSGVQAVPLNLGRIKRIVPYKIIIPALNRNIICK